MKKRLIVLSNSPHMYQGAGGRTRIVHEIREVLRHEADVRLLCLVQLKRYLKTGELKKARKALEADCGVPVTYFPRIPAFNSWALSRFADYLNMIAIWFYTLVWRTRNIHAQGISVAVPVAMLKNILKRVRLLTDVHGVLPEEAAYAKSLSPLQVGRLEKLEKFVLERSDLIFLVSERMQVHYLEKYGLSVHNRFVVPCLTEDISNGTGVIPESLRDIIGKRLVFTYSGSFRHYQLVSETLHIFKKIKERYPEAFYLILSNQVDVFTKNATVAGINQTDFRVLSLSRDQVNNHLKAADIGFLLRDDSVVNKVASPTKFAEYLLAGLPVITTPWVGDYTGFVIEHRIGCVVDSLTEPGEELFSFIDDYKRNREEYKTRARDFAEAHLTWSSQNRAIVSAMKQYRFL